MAKAKTKSATSIPNRHIHSRLSYLYQAASYLSDTAHQNHTRIKSDDSSEGVQNGEVVAGEQPDQNSKQVNHFLTQLRGVSRRGLVRIRPEMKRTICKRCDALLVAGQTSTMLVENASRDGQKPWADVLVIRCNACQTAKRFPVGQNRSRSEKHKVNDKVAGDASDAAHGKTTQRADTTNDNPTELDSA